MKFTYTPTDIRIFIGTANLGGVDTVVFTTSAAEVKHINEGGKLCGKILSVDMENGRTYARRDKVAALRESGCSMTRAGYAPAQVERQNGEYDRAIALCGLNNG